MNDAIKTLADLEYALYDVIDRTNVRVTMEARGVFSRALEQALDVRERAEIEQEYYFMKHK